LKQSDTRGLKITNLKAMRRTAGYSLLDHRRYEGSLEFNVDLVENILAQYKQKW